jgi:hypothetical protein
MNERELLVLSSQHDILFFAFSVSPHGGRYQGRGFKCNLILVHLSATPLDDTVNSETLRLNLNSL